MNLSQKTDSLRIVVLAAGKGKRMGGGFKVLKTVAGKPLISYVLDAIETAQVDGKPVVVVSPDGEPVRQAIGDRADFAVQTEQLGTAHAVASAEPVIGNSAQHILVLCGDVPFVTPSTLKGLVALHTSDGAVLTMATAPLPDFNDWRVGFRDLGRIVRDERGNITAIAEARDATPQQFAIHEINPAVYMFSAQWLWENIAKVERKNAQGEYYLTDLVHLAITQGQHISSMAIDAYECVGVNTPEQLALAESLCKMKG